MIGKLLSLFDTGPWTFLTAAVLAVAAVARANPGTASDAYYVIGALGVVAIYLAFFLSL